MIWFHIIASSISCLVTTWTSWTAWTVGSVGLQGADLLSATLPRQELLTLGVTDLVQRNAAKCSEIVKAM